MKPEAYAHTDVGLKRTNNEDKYLIDSDHGLFVVCDGMGGHAAGEVAAERASTLVAKHIESNRQVLHDVEKEPAGYFRLLELAESAVREACKILYEDAKSNPELAGMGTTLTLLLVAHEKAVLAHVGDSRLYLMRSEELHQLTSDHTFANELVAAGQLTAEEAQNSRFSHMLMRSLGVHENVVVDSLLFDLFPGDVFLLCSDGLSNYFQDHNDVEQILNDEDLDRAPQRFIELAKERGGADNITALVVRIDPNAKSQYVDPHEVKQCLEALDDAFLFNGLSLNRLLRLINICETNQFDSKAHIVKPGETICGLYLVLSGEAAVESANGETAPTLSRGDFFGAESLLRPLKCQWSISAVTPVSLLIIPGESFEKLTKRQPRLGRWLLHRLARHLSEKLGQDYGMN